MTRAYHTQLPGVSLHFAGGGVPDWIQLTPAGPEIQGRDGRAFRLSDPEAVAQRFRDSDQPIVVDIEHASALAEIGQAAPAQGWVEEIEVRDGALWGRVSWTQAGRQLMEAEAYRYVSPVFTYDAESREILELVSAGLVHSPNLRMQALNHRDNEETPEMDKAIREALGLDAEATAADAVVAINKLKDDKATALNAAERPDPEKFVPKADHDLALNKLAAHEQAAAEREAADQQAAVDEAVEAGKIAPASKEYHLATCKAVGVDKFREMMGTLPVIGGTTEKPGEKKGGDTAATALNAEQAALARALGTTPEKFAEMAQKGA